MQSSSIKKLLTTGAMNSLNPPDTIKTLPWYFLKNSLLRANDGDTFFRSLFTNIFKWYFLAESKAIRAFNDLLNGIFPSIAKSVKCFICSMIASFSGSFFKLMAANSSIASTCVKVLSKSIINQGCCMW